jgi:hypothetical protein
MTGRNVPKGEAPAHDDSIPWASKLTFLCPSCDQQVDALSQKCSNCQREIPLLARDATEVSPSEMEENVRSLREYRPYDPKHQTIREARKVKLGFAILSPLGLLPLAVFLLTRQGYAWLPLVGLVLLLAAIVVPFHFFGELRKLSRPPDLTTPSKTVRLVLQVNEAMRFGGFADIDEIEKDYLLLCCLTPYAQKPLHVLRREWIQYRTQLKSEVGNLVLSLRRKLPATQEEFQSVSLFPCPDLQEIAGPRPDVSLVRFRLCVGCIKSSDQFYLCGSVECVWHLVHDGTRWLLMHTSPPPVLSRV